MYLNILIRSTSWSKVPGWTTYQTSQITMVWVLLLSYYIEKKNFVGAADVCPIGTKYRFFLTAILSLFELWNPSRCVGYCSLPSGINEHVNFFLKNHTRALFTLVDLGIFAWIPMIFAYVGVWYADLSSISHYILHYNCSIWAVYHIFLNRNLYKFNFWCVFHPIFSRYFILDRKNHCMLDIWFWNTL